MKNLTKYDIILFVAAIMVKLNIGKERHFLKRIYSVAGFAFLFTYILTFVFEGKVLYGLLKHYNAKPELYITLAIAFHFAGLFTGGLIAKNIKTARKVMISAMGFCVLFSLPFYFNVPFIWSIGLIALGYASGNAVAAWGFFLKAFTPRNERLRSCADVLIISNILMIAINVTCEIWSPFAALTFSLACIPLGCFFISLLPVVSDTDKTEKPLNFVNPIWILALFIFIITINSGLMYQVINPAFEHLKNLVIWYWALPYILALIILRLLPIYGKRSHVLYIGLGMIMTAFISFMLLSRRETDYLIVDTLMLGACGIFDLFWWSILGEMLDYTDNPAKIFGIGLSSNVLGVLCGGLLGMLITSIKLPSAEVAVIALIVVCITLIILPSLNRQLVLLLKSHTYLSVYSGMSQNEQNDVVGLLKLPDPLTSREKEVLQLVLSGKSNCEIASELFISQNTVKTHIRNIYSKYNVKSRMELILTLLKTQQ